MKRSEFIKLLLLTPLTMGLKDLIAFDHAETSEKMPVLFIGHGNPMNAIQENDITQGWREIGKKLNPKAILAISAHWETRGTKVTMAPKPQTIHDFGGFPRELFEMEYPAPGSPEMGKTVIEHLKNHSVLEDHEWGLDHGTWSVLVKMFPKANIPVLQLSLNYRLTLAEHYELAKELAFLRHKGVLIVGSGNIVHNLRYAQWDSDTPYDWATAYDEQVKNYILKNDFNALLKGNTLNREAQLSIPTPDHYAPMIYSLALKGESENISFFNEAIKMGSMSMRSFIIG